MSVKVKANLRAISFPLVCFTISNSVSILVLLFFRMLDAILAGEAGELSGVSPQKVYFALLALGHRDFLKLS